MLWLRPRLVGNIQPAMISCYCCYCCYQSEIGEKSNICTFYWESKMVSEGLSDHPVRIRAAPSVRDRALMGGPPKPQALAPWEPKPAPKDTIYCPSVAALFICLK